MNQEKILFQKLHEKAEIILEIGFTLTRIGFQSDMIPRKIIQTLSNIFPPIQQFLKFKTEDNQRLLPFDAYRLLQNQFDYETKMEEFLHFIFDQEIAINPRERQFHLIYNYYQQEDIVNIIAKLLFKKFEVSKITFLVANMLPLYLTGHFSGIVIDGGFLQTTMSPFCDGFSLLHLGGNIGHGGMQISANLLREILTENPQILKQSNLLQMIQNPDWMEEVKIRIGRILPLWATHNLQLNDQQYRIIFDSRLLKKMQASKIQIPIQYGSNVTLSYYAVGTAITNTLFGNIEEEQPNLAYNFLKIIKQLHNMDLARKLLNNLVFCGGLCLIPNFISRFREEVIQFLKNDFKELQTICNNIQITQTQNHPQSLNWVAGSLLTQINLTEKLTLNYATFKENGYMLTNKSDAFNFISVGNEKKKVQKVNI